MYYPPSLFSGAGPSVGRPPAPSPQTQAPSGCTLLGCQVDFGFPGDFPSGGGSSVVAPSHLPILVFQGAGLGEAALPISKTLAAPQGSAPLLKVLWVPSPAGHLATPPPPFPP